MILDFVVLVGATWGHELSSPHFGINAQGALEETKRAKFAGDATATRSLASKLRSHGERKGETRMENEGVPEMSTRKWLCESRKGMPWRKPFPIEERFETFWKNVEVKGDDECWPWKGRIEPSTGYGKFTWGGKPATSAHRFAWFSKNGEIPKGILVCHKCDNRPCCNPTHLFLGTIKDNNRDMFKKGRGSMPPHSPRFTPEQVLRIRSKWVPYRVTMSMIAREEGVSTKAVELAIHKYKSVVSI